MGSPDARLPDSVDYRQGFTDSIRPLTGSVRAVRSGKNGCGPNDGLALASRGSRSSPSARIGFAPLFRDLHALRILHLREEGPFRDLWL